MWKNFQELNNNNNNNNNAEFDAQFPQGFWVKLKESEKKVKVQGHY